MSSESQAYYSAITGCFQKILQQDSVFEKCGKICAEAIKQDRLIHVIGPGGHSNLAAEELLWRAGSLAAFNPMLDAGFNLIHGALRSNLIERTPGYARAVFDAYRAGVEGEVVIIVNAYGINSMCIDGALLAKERKMTSIGVTGTAFAERVPAGHQSRHPSGRNLAENVDVFVNSHLPYGDAVVEIDGLEQKVGPTSTFVNCFCVNLIVIETVKALRAEKIDPPIWMSANLPGGDESNRRLVKRYGGRVKHLL